MMWSLQCTLWKIRREGGRKMKIKKSRFHALSRSMKDTLDMSEMLYICNMVLNGHCITSVLSHINTYYESCSIFYIPMYLSKFFDQLIFVFSRHQRYNSNIKIGTVFGFLIKDNYFDDLLFLLTT